MSHQFRDLSLLKFIAAFSPEYQEPVHLAAWCAILERCLYGPVRGLCSVPIRHFKTQTTLHAIVWLLMHDPTLRFIIMTFDHVRAEFLGQEAKMLCERAANVGIPIGPAKGQNKKTEWANEHGGGVAAMSADQSKEGHDVDILIVDDPMTELAADNLEQRDKIDKAIAHYTARVGRPGRKGSVLLIMSRLAPDDPMGRRITRMAIPPWDLIEHPAISDMGKETEHAFAPWVMDLEHLKNVRAEWREEDPSERGFFARYQNDPRPTTSNLFKPNPPRYERLPEFGRFRTIIGLDLAYTINPHSDCFAMFVLRVHETGVGYVVRVLREKRDLFRACHILKQAKHEFPGAQFYTYASGPEKGPIQYLADEGLHVNWLQARYEKSTRARHTIDAWNCDKIAVPTVAGWDLAGFLRRTVSFTGLDKDGNDDEQDAMVAACDGGFLIAGGAPTAFGKPRISRY